MTTQSKKKAHLLGFIQHGVNSHATGDRRALAWLRWRRRLPQAFVVTRRTMPLTSPPELIAVALTADRTIAVSAAVARSLRRRLHPGGRLRIVTNGISPFWDPMKVATYFFVLIDMALVEATLFVVNILAFIAIGLGQLIGPLFIPWHIVRRAEHDI